MFGRGTVNRLSSGQSRPGTLSVALLAALLVGAASVGNGQEMAAADGSEPKLPTDAMKHSLTPLQSHELIQALKEIQGAVKKESAARHAHEVELIKASRPARTVTPPTLTSEDVDQLVGRTLAANDPKVEPAPPTSDIEFARRIYFDMIGKPPTPEQLMNFSKDRASDKRVKLIDRLLTSRDFAQNWAKYWRDVVRFHSTSENPNRVRFDMLEEWLAEQFLANNPWDQICTGMITATGRNDENGAVGFALSHEAQAVELAGEVSRVFMGVQIQCAQCHDHKTDSWKQVQFHEFAAFFSGTRARQVVQGGQGQLPVMSIEAQPRARYSMPANNNPTNQIPIAPRFFLTKAGSSTPEPSLPDTLGAIDRRALAALYITGQDNPWFAKAYINRIWSALMGETFYEPIDDIGPERTARGAEVLEALATQWQQGGYDIRWLYRTILNTQAYQRRVRSTANAAGKTLFASNCPSRMRSDQVFDALVEALRLPLDFNGNLVNGNANKGKGPIKAATAASKAGGLAAVVPTRKEAQKSAEAAGLAGQVSPKKNQLAARMGGPRLLFDKLFGVDPSASQDDVMGTIPQALYMMNSPLVNNGTAARPGSVLGDVLVSAPNERSALEILYMRALSRHPTPKEVEICGHYLQGIGNTKEGFEDIYWSLINSTEFLTRR